MDSELHNQLRQATRQCHHALDHHRLLLPLLGAEVTVVEYGNALAALHGIYARSEAAVFTYLQQCPGLFDYRSRRKLPALASDLSALGRAPVPMNPACPSLDSTGALFGTLYTLEGSTLGGQYIARHLPPRFPLRFYTVYGDQTARRWGEFLQIANARCPRSEYETAAAAAVALFVAIKAHLDNCQRYFAQT
jgi:heme oxygenase (biliverdin-IX-beta and delta-forming)